MSDVVLQYLSCTPVGDWWPVRLGHIHTIDGTSWVVTGVDRRPGGKVYLASYAKTMQVDPGQIDMRWAPAKVKPKRKHAHE